jgi:hypothetical protein
MRLWRKPAAVKGRHHYRVLDVEDVEGNFRAALQVGRPVHPPASGVGALAMTQIVNALFPPN